jgi:hypothetical protein
MMIGFFVAIEWIVVKYIMMFIQSRKIAKMKVKPLIDKSRVPSTAEMAIYHAPIIMGTMMYGMMNFAFINLALVDISRRNK